MMKLIGLSLIILIGGAGLVFNSMQPEPPVSDYARELAEIDAEIARLNNNNGLGLIYQYYRRATLTLDYADFALVETALERAFQDYGAQPELYSIRAHLQFKLHRLGASEESLAQLNDYPETAAVQALRADIALQQGRYHAAEQAYVELSETDPRWDHLARLAYFRFKTGQTEVADALYQRAQQQLSAKQMRSFAWLELQRGLIDLDDGHFQAALAHYRRADAAYSGYWLVQEHIAEVLNYLGERERAIAIYQQVLETVRHPELLAALANITQYSDPDNAQRLWTQAEQTFATQEVRYPEATLGHKLEYLLAKPALDPKLIEYARRNVQLRPNAETKLLLLKAYLRVGQIERAKSVFAELQQTPWRIPQWHAIADIE